MAKKIKSKAPKEKIEQYIAVVEAIGWEWKGAANMYTSHNGHMFSYLSPAGEVAVRLPKDEREAFMEKYNTELSVQYNTVMKEYPVVPSDLLERTEELAPYFEKSLAYVTSLKPKPTTKKK